MDGGAMSNDLEWLISVDDHVIEPGHVWQRWMPEKFKDAAPKVVHDDDGFAKWEYDGKRTAMTGVGAVAGTPREVWDPSPMDIENPSFLAYSDPEARLAVMNEDGVLASLIFPMFPRFCGQIFLEASDKDVALAGVQAYNDWMIDEWCATAPDRFIPLAIVPMWDPELAAAETRRVGKKGARSIAFSENPTKLGLPSIHDSNRHWDPLFEACSETGLVMSIHVGSSSQIKGVSPDAPLVSTITFLALTAQDTMIDWIWSGNLLRFPDLKLCLSESGISWVPSVLERIRRDVDRQQWARSAKSSFEGNLLTGDMKPVGDRTVFGDIPQAFDPLEVFHRSIFTCCIADDFGWDTLDYLGYDNVMIETDYPHSDASYPHSAKLANEQLRHLTPEQRGKILRDNASRVFNFTAVDPARLPPL
jgi:predicted TIM-barrel fold metal-dependent hydrolase